MLDSELVVNAHQLAGITADIEYNVPVGGLDGSIKANAKDVVNGDTEFVGNMELLWAISADAANFAAVSVVDSASGHVYNFSSDVNYGSNSYSVSAIETVSKLWTNANGGYGGDVHQW